MSFYKAILFKLLAPMAYGFTLFLYAGISHATLINFDDLYYDEEHPEFWGNPISDQYASKGLIIEDGYLMQYWAGSEDIISSPNYLLAGLSMSFNFVGDLPTYVSMYVNSFRQEAIYFEAFGASGFLEVKKTKGFAGPDDDIPYEPKQFISFTAAEGIKSITVSGFYGRSTAGEIDNLMYKYSLPEPSSVILLAVGLFSIIALGRRRKT